MELDQRQGQKLRRGKFRIPVKVICNSLHALRVKALLYSFWFFLLQLH